jgi:hypothetical protein
MVSLRHVEKQKQPRPKGQQSSPASGSTGGSTGTGGATPTAQADTGSGSPSSSGQQSGKDFKHEGETVNTEVRCKKNKIEILDGTTVVATYDKQAKSWTFSNFKKLTLKADDEMNFTSKKVTIEATGDVLDLKGKPIKFNGGGPESPPFQVPG